VTRFIRTHDRIFLLAAAFALAFVAMAVYDALSPDAQGLAREDVDATVAGALQEYDARPALSSQAYRVIAPSVVRVRRLNRDPEVVEEQGVGTGVVVVATGQILTSFHVVAGADRIGVMFADGSESEATIVSVQPEKDLAVLQAEVVPEGLPPATLASSAGLRPGDDVVVVGNPFGIGPSVSAGVISGIGRRYYSQDRRLMLENLIQFDAAANPGNSGGPLVNRRGEVVGIVTSILNPTEDSFFVGIGFAVPIETASAALGPNPF
jgi:S1-C subfamily serine protease